MALEEAREKLALAKSQLHRVQVASRDPEDAEEAVNWAFYAMKTPL